MNWCKWIRIGGCATRR